MKLKTVSLISAAVVLLGGILWGLMSGFELTPFAESKTFKLAELRGPTPPSEREESPSGDEHPSREIKFKFPEGMGLGLSGDVLDCLPVGGETSDDLVISEAKDVSLCRKSHYSLSDTSSPRAAVRSVQDAFDRDEAHGEGESHNWEIFNLMEIYVRLINEEEVNGLREISKEESRDGENARILLERHEKLRADPAS